MSHRKFNHPRHGNLGFLPRKRAKSMRGRVRCFPRDNPKLKPHLTAFMAYKAGMTHIVREVEKPGSKLNKKEVVDAVTVVDCPPMVVVGVAGYVRTPKGLKCLHTVWAQHLSDAFLRVFYRAWYRAKRKHFTEHTKHFVKKNNQLQRKIKEIKQYCDVIRVIAHTQPDKVHHLKRKKAYVMEIQVNGGNVAMKMDFAWKLMEQEVKVNSLFEENEMVDSIAITKGHGFEGVIKRWGVTRLPRKTHKGLRKVACIGSWHPARVGRTVPRAGQHGFHRRTIFNRKIYKVGKSLADEKYNAKLDSDLTEKEISPMGGFKKYGRVRNEYLLLKGSIQGTRRRPITLRKALHRQTTRVAQEKIHLKFIDTSSKRGNGRFQTNEEKRKFLGPRKKDKKTGKA